MKITVIIILALICLVPVVTTAEHFKESPYVKMANGIIARVSKRMEKKHRMKLIGEGGAMMGSVKMLSLSFQIFRPLTKDEARVLVVDAAQNLLEEINKNEAIRPYLETYPFDAKRVKIFLLINKPSGELLYHPDLGAVRASEGEVLYSTNHPEWKVGYQSQEVETFEEAVNILEGKCPPKSEEIQNEVKQ